MKAESIEQIREHLKRGGRVAYRPFTLCIVAIDDERYWYNDGGASGLHTLKLDDWELLPGDNEKPQAKTETSISFTSNDLWILYGLADDYVQQALRDGIKTISGERIRDKLTQGICELRNPKS